MFSYIQALMPWSGLAWPGPVLKGLEQFGTLKPKCRPDWMDISAQLNYKITNGDKKYYIVCRLVHAPFLQMKTCSPLF